MIKKAKSLDLTSSIVLPYSKFKQTVDTQQAIREGGNVIIVLTGNAKGGVGKTTVATNLSAALATNKTKLKICAIDLDYQSNLTQALIPKDVKIKKGMYHILDGQKPDIEDCIYDTVHPRLKLFPSAVEISGLEIPLTQGFPHTNMIVRDYLREFLLENFDLTIIDVGPNINVLLYVGLVVSDAVFVVVDVASSNSLVNIKTLVQHIEEVKKSQNPDLKNIRIVMNKLNRSRLIDKKNMKDIYEVFGKDNCFNTVIPVSADFREVERLGHMSIFGYKPGSKGSTAFRTLGREVVNGYFKEK